MTHPNETRTEEELIESTLHLADTVIAKMGLPPSADHCAARSAALLALVKAARSYNASLGAWKPYVCGRMRWAAADELRSIDWVPRKVRDSGGPVQTLVAIDDSVFMIPCRDKTPDEAVSSMEIAKEVFERMKVLTNVQRKVIVGRYFDYLTFSEIGKQLGFTGARAGQIHAEALKKMREN